METPISTGLAELQSINTVPKHDDPFGQLSSGELVLRARLFSVPNSIAVIGIRNYLLIDDPMLSGKDVSAEAETESPLESPWKHMKTLPSGPHDKYFFTPLVGQPGFFNGLSEASNIGLLLKNEGCQSDGRVAFRRVALAVVGRKDGQFGDSGIFVAGWSLPPWSKDETELVLIV